MPIARPGAPRPPLAPARSLALALALAFAFALTACGPTQPASDAGPPPDAGPVDAAPDAAGDPCARCAANATCVAGACRVISSIRVDLEPATVATFGVSRVTVRAQADGNSVDVTSAALFEVDGVPDGSDAAGRVEHAGGAARYFAPSAMGAHAIRATIPGTALEASAQVTVRARTWVQLGGGAVRSAAPMGDRAVASAPSLAVAGDALWVAYATRATASPRPPTVVRVATLDLARPADAAVERTGPGGLAGAAMSPAPSARRPSIALVPTGEGGARAPCVAFELEARPWESNPRVSCWVNDAFRDVALPAVNRDAAVGAIALVANASRADLYWVNDALGQSVHVPVTAPGALDWSRLAPVVAPHWDVDVFERVAPGYDAAGRPFVVATTLENLPRVSTVARRYDADARAPDEAVVGPYLGGDAVGMPSRPVDRARFRQTGALALATRDALAAYAASFRPGPTRFPRAPAETSTVLRVVETGRGARPTVLTVAPVGGPFPASEVTAALEPSVSYDRAGALLVAFEARVRGRRMVHVVRVVDGARVAAMTDAAGLSRAVASGAPAVLFTGRDPEEFVVAFPTYTRGDAQGAALLGAYAGLEVWGWM